MGESGWREKKEYDLRIKLFENRGRKQESFLRTTVKESIIFKKALPHGRIANFAKFEDDDKAKHHSEWNNHGCRYWDSREDLWSWCVYLEGDNNETKTKSGCELFYWNTKRNDWE